MYFFNKLVDRKSLVKYPHSSLYVLFQIFFSNFILSQYSDMRISFSLFYFISFLHRFLIFLSKTKVISYPKVIAIFKWPTAKFTENVLRSPVGQWLSKRPIRIFRFPGFFQPTKKRRVLENRGHWSITIAIL